MCIQLLLNGVFYKCLLDKVYGYVIQVFYILTDFLSTFCINYWERRVKINSQVSLWICLFFLSIPSVFPSLFWSSVVSSWKIDFFYYYEVSVFIPSSMACSEVYFAVDFYNAFCFLIIVYNISFPILLLLN